MTRRFLPTLLRVLGALAAFSCFPGALQAQAPTWNDPEILELVRRARLARERIRAESPARTYHARADGHVYFFLDREDGSPPIPLRVDQVSLDVTWRPAGGSRQILRGVRSRELLPIQELRFYQDRLTISQDAYADEIRVGEGRDVRGVPHPLGPASEDSYDFSSGATVMIQPADEAPRRIREVVVRPRDPERPGFLGSLHVDESSGSVVRMEFTFTEASYPDPRNDYVRVHLEHMLWDGDIWLPRTQLIEVRRESPRWDLPVGTVVRSRLEIRDHQEGTLEPGPLRGPTLLVDASAGSYSTRFEEGLFDRMTAEGLGGSTGLSSTPLADIERLASSGLPSVRPHADRVSSVLRANRSEGLRLGAGVSITRTTGARAEALVGYAFGSGHPSIDIGLHPPRGTLRPSLRARWRTLRDVGWPTDQLDLVGSLGSILSGEDRIDPYLVTGLELTMNAHGAGASWSWDLSVERHESAAWSWREGPVLGDAARPVRPIEAGTEVAAVVQVAGMRHVAGAANLTWSVASGAGSWARKPFLQLEGAWALGLGGPGSTVVEATVDAALRAGATPIQRHYFLGGPGTLPGHDWRAWSGTRSALVGARISREILPAWVGVEGFAAAGWVDGSGRDAPDWAARSSGQPRASFGLGLTALRGILRLRLARGLGAVGHTTLFLSVDPSIRPLL